MVLSLLILDVKCDPCISQPFAMLHCSMVLEVRWDFRSTTSSLTQAPGSTSVLAWSVSHMLPLLWYCANRFLYCPSLSNQCRWTSTCTWSNLQQILDVARSEKSEHASCCQSVEVPGSTRHMHCTSRAAKLKSFGKSGFVPYLSQFCCRVVGRIWIIDSNTQCRIWEEVDFHPDQICFWITQQRKCSPSTCVQSCDTCKMYASLRSISVCTCRCTDCIKSCVLGKLLFIAIRFVVLVLLCSAKMKPVGSRSWTGSKSQRGTRNLWLDIYQSLHIYHWIPFLVNSCSSSLRAKFFAGSSNLLIARSPSVFAWWQTITSQILNGSLTAPGHPELDDAPVAVVVNVQGSC